MNLCPVGPGRSSCKVFIILLLISVLHFPQKTKPLSLEKSFKLLQGQEKRQKVRTYKAGPLPTDKIFEAFFDMLWTTL